MPRGFTRVRSHAPQDLLNTNTRQAQDLRDSLALRPRVYFVGTRLSSSYRKIAERIDFLKSARSRLSFSEWALQ
jgi:hypothetical protein